MQRSHIKVRWVECRQPPRPLTALPTPTVARHSAERLSSAKVLFALGYALEILGLDIGISRILLTFLLQ